MPNIENIDPVVEQIDTVLSSKQIPLGYSNDFWGGITYVRNLLNCNSHRPMTDSDYLALLRDIGDVLDRPHMDQTDVRNILNYVENLLSSIYFTEHPIKVPED